MQTPNKASVRFVSSDPSLPREYRCRCPGNQNDGLQTWVVNPKHPDYWSIRRDRAFDSSADVLRESHSVATLTEALEWSYPVPRWYDREYGPRSRNSGPRLRACDFKARLNPVTSRRCSVQYGTQRSHERGSRSGSGDRSHPLRILREPSFNLAQSAGDRV